MPGKINPATKNVIDKQQLFHIATASAAGRSAVSTDVSIMCIDGHTLAFFVVRYPRTLQYLAVSVVDRN